MGRKSKLKKQRKAVAKESDISLPRGDIERLNQLGYGEHNQLRSPEIPFDRPEPKL